MKMSWLRRFPAGFTAVKFAVEERGRFGRRSLADILLPDTIIVPITFRLDGR